MKTPYNAFAIEVENQDGIILTFKSLSQTSKYYKTYNEKINRAIERGEPIKINDQFLTFRKLNGSYKYSKTAYNDNELFSEKVLNLLCKDYTLEEIESELKCSETILRKRLIQLKAQYNVRTMQGLIYKFTMNS